MKIRKFQGIEFDLVPILSFPMYQPNTTGEIVIRPSIAVLEVGWESLRNQ